MIDFFFILFEFYMDHYKVKQTYNKVYKNQNGIATKKLVK